MTPERWDSLSSWLNAWLEADPAERAVLRARLAVEQPDLLAEAETLAEGWATSIRPWTRACRGRWR